MRRILILSALVIAGLGTSQPSFAQSKPERPAAECHDRGAKKCPPAREGKNHREKQDHHTGKRQPNDDRRDDRHQARRDPHHKDDRPAPPRIGDNVGQGERFRPSRKMHLPDAPRGQQYRVIGDHIVLVDKHNHRITQVVGRLQR